MIVSMAQLKFEIFTTVCKRRSFLEIEISLVIETNRNGPFNLLHRYGRLKIVIIGMMFCSVIGLLKSFSVNYLMYLTVR